MKTVMTKDDVNFQRWLEMVSPTPMMTAKLLTTDSVDINTILQLLLDLFQVLLGLGCFAKSKLTNKVKAALTLGLSGSKSELESILVSYQK